MNLALLKAGVSQQQINDFNSKKKGIKPGTSFAGAVTGSSLGPRKIIGGFSGTFTGPGFVKSSTGIDAFRSGELTGVVTKTGIRKQRFETKAERDKLVEKIKKAQIAKAETLSNPILVTSASTSRVNKPVDRNADLRAKIKLQPTSKPLTTAQKILNRTPTLVELLFPPLFAKRQIQSGVAGLKSTFGSLRRDPFSPIDAVKKGNVAFEKTLDFEKDKVRIDKTNIPSVPDIPSRIVEGAKSTATEVKTEFVKEVTNSFLPNSSPSITSSGNQSQSGFFDSLNQGIRSVTGLLVVGIAGYAAFKLFGGK